MSGPILLALRLLLIISLYAFLGWALYLIWRDLKSQSQKLSEPQNPPILLTFGTGATCKEYRFESPPVTIGRDPLCELHLSDTTISAQHARLDYHHAQWWLVDLKSTNGTFLNQQQVLEAVVLTDGDEIRCGQVALTISISEGRS